MPHEGQHACLCCERDRRRAALRLRRIAARLRGLTAASRSSLGYWCRRRRALSHATHSICLVAVSLAVTSSSAIVSTCMSWCRSWHSPFCSSSTAPMSRRIEAAHGTMPTTGAALHFHVQALQGIDRVQIAAVPLGEVQIREDVGEVGFDAVALALDQGTRDCPTAGPVVGSRE